MVPDLSVIDSNDGIMGVTYQGGVRRKASARAELRPAAPAER
jgi:hypothetical protein